MQPTEWNIQEVKTRRRNYLVSFFLMIVGTIYGSLFGSEYAFTVHFVMGIIFLVLFTNVARQVLGYTVTTLIVLSILILFVPIISFLTIAFLDRNIYDAIKNNDLLS